MIPYEGLEAFNEAGKQLKMATATRKIKQKEKFLNAYFPTGNTRITWQSAVDGKVSFINSSATSQSRYIGKGNRDLTVTLFNISNLYLHYSLNRNAADDKYGFGTKITSRQKPV